jgi:hypothetical protein
LAAVRIVARNRSRGALHANGRPVTAEDLAAESGIPVRACAAAVKLLASPEIGWLTHEPPSDADQPGNARATPGQSAPIERATPGGRPAIAPSREEQRRKDINPPNPPAASPLVGGGGGGGELTADGDEARTLLVRAGVSPRKARELAQAHPLPAVRAAIEQGKRGDTPAALTVSLLERGDAAEAVHQPEATAKQAAGRAWLARAPREHVENALREFRAEHPDAQGSDAELRGRLTFAEFVGGRLCPSPVAAAGGER